ncbi:hypothetical protein BOTBODRAFT_37460 [Botryobasidium botryosum FD-172 SS1]|uniref:Defective in cullin neddylation protein n=1 Tax=Botryobasidium botryosum (strain FD-172 SS1) TaxID=930990 RepID=A0A067LZP8_BOTB1|nr:hypothetical protein BOTBODRAFT_37460 [Botryobasidium botryosum FD-172 SS1]
MSSKARDQARKDALVKEFRNVSGASQNDANRYLKRYGWNVASAVDAYFEEYNGRPDADPLPSLQKLGALFDQYKDPSNEYIGVDGTMAWCKDLGIELEDVVLLALAYELKSPTVGEWERKGWVDGWRNLKCEDISQMTSALTTLRTKLSSDSQYYRSVYLYTFDFAKTEGQRSIAVETATAFWGLLLPVGLSGEALAHVSSEEDDEREEGWKEEYNQWWFDFLEEKGGKGISRDTWNMFLDFVKNIDSQFAHHDLEAAWPSTIDEFVDYAKERLANHMS